MEWLNNLTNGENGAPINLVLITLGILVLVLIVSWIFKKMTGTAARRAMRSRVPRLSITDSTTVDEKRYLVMVRRDNVEHLLLIGGANDIVVETNIVRAQSAQKQSAMPRASEAVETQTTSIEEKPALEKETSFAAPLAGAAAIGVVGLSAVTSTASSAVSATTDVASSATEAVVDQASDITEAVVSNVSEAASSVADMGSGAVDTVVEAISIEPEAKIETPDILDVVDTMEPVEPIVETIEEVEVPEMDLESEISAKLDDALSGEAIELDSSQVSVETVEAAVPGTGNDDEMQRLLDELSGETKEPAQ